MENLTAKITGFVQRPWIIVIGLIGGLSSIIALPLSVYLANVKPNLTFQYSKDSKISIADKNIYSGLHIYHDAIDGEIVDSLSVIKIKIWNAGNKEIRKEDIRKPINLRSLDATKILEAEITKKTSDITNLKLNVKQKLLGIIGLDFDVLEANEGVEIQLIYMGGTDKDFTLDGKIINQDSFQNYFYNPPAYTLNTILTICLSFFDCSWTN